MQVSLIQMSTLILKGQCDVYKTVPAHVILRISKSLQCIHKAQSKNLIIFLEVQIHAITFFACTLPADALQRFENPQWFIGHQK